MRVIIDYLPEEREAYLATDEVNKVWASVYRACRDNSTGDSVHFQDKSIRLPWYSFLLAKEFIGYYLSKYKTTVEFTPRAKQLLIKANEKIASYKTALEATELSDEDLKAKLLNAGFRRKLTDKQTNNVKKIGALSSAATFSVPGAGKTTEALAFYCCKKSENTKLLIVCPKNAFAVWEEQISDIFKEKNLSIVRLTGGYINIKTLLISKPDISLITYQQLPNVERVIADYLLENDVYVFLDESHRIKKGNTGVIGSALLSIAHLPRVKCILSGTPMPNTIADLVPQFRFLYPEISVDADTVKDVIKPIYVRTTKTELHIPEITRVKREIPLSPAQRQLYQLLCSEYARENFQGLNALDRRKLRSLGKSALTLLQLVSNPTLLAKRNYFQHKDLLNALLSEGDSPKLEYVTNRARQLALQGKKTIIWSGFVQNVELIAARLYDLGAEYIHGGVEAGSEDEEFTRERKIKRFHDDDSCFVMVANPAACSEGISLHTVCHNAIYLDRNYNAAQYLQSEDRIHRFGLKPEQQTLVEILCSPDTIDESVSDRLSLKVDLMKEVLDDPDLNIDPIDFNKDDDSEYFDRDDALSFIQHIKKETQL